MAERPLESSIQTIGRILGEQSAEEAAGWFHPRHWNQMLLEWGMQDEHFKVQLFRFIDVLPALRTDTQFTRVLREYFGDDQALPLPLRWTLRLLPSTKISSHIGAHLLRKQALRMATMFMAGESVEDSLNVITQLWQMGCAFSIDLLGEATVSETEADLYRDRCLEALGTLERCTRSWENNPLLERDHLGSIPRVQLSIKLSALTAHLDPIDPTGSFHRVAGRLRPILDLAMSLPAAVTFDTEQAELKELIPHIFMKILSEDSYRHYPHGGIALQAYLTDAGLRFYNLLNWVQKRDTPITVRLVKGAYWDSETVQYDQRGWPSPVFRTKAETDANYETLTRTILNEPDLIRPAFGTHNLRSLAHAEAAAQGQSRPHDSYEFQMLFGMGQSLQKAVTEYGRRLRVYAPVGELIPGMAYLVRRLLENTSNESFIRQMHDKSSSIDVLLNPPMVKDSSMDSSLSSDMQKGDSAKQFQNEPHIDFSQASAHASMTQAIQNIRGQLGQSISYSLANKLNPDGEELISVNPSSPTEVVARFQSLTPKILNQIFEAAQGAYEKWQTVSPKERTGIMMRAANLMRARRHELSAWEIFETGKSWREADADVAEAIDFLEFYARDIHRLSVARRLGEEPGELNLLTVAPRGLVVVIPPWNFPLAIPTGMVSASLVTGNVALFKPSERAPMVGYQLFSLLTEAGVPQNVLQFLPGGPELGQSLVSHPQVHMVAFTGSKEVGLRILAQAVQIATGQRHIKHVVAEMGGKNAIIVDETADLDEAVVGVKSSFTGFQGQKCSACSRVIVLDSIYDSFIERLSQAAISLTIGPPENPENMMGPLIDGRALQKVREYAAIGKTEGKLILDRQIDLPGYFQGPVIFANIEPHHRLAQEEIFGPVLAVMRARNFSEALHIANDSSFALSGGIYSRSPSSIRKAYESFDVGNLYINRSITGSLVGRQPFGGHRLSGMGKKAGGEGYLQQFMVERVISENTLRRGFAPTA